MSEELIKIIERSFPIQIHRGKGFAQKQTCVEGLAIKGRKEEAEGRFDRRSQCIFVAIENTEAELLQLNVH